MVSLFSGRLKDDELRRRRDLLDLAEQPFELEVVAQVAVADDPQFATFAQRRFGLGEHAPGEEVAHHLLLVERRIAQNEVQRTCRLFGQAVPGADFSGTLAVNRQPVVPGRLHGHIAFIHQRQLRLGVVQGVDDAQHAVAAAQVSYGQTRIQMVWHRIILPDTSSVQLDNLVGSDPVGYAGLEDGVDWHWDRIFAGAALTTLLGIGAELAAPENRQDGNRVIIAGRDSVQDTVNQIGQEVTRRNPNIQPTLTNRPGLPVRVIVNRDLVLQPYQPLFFNRGASR